MRAQAFLLLTLLVALGRAQQTPVLRVVDLKVSDGAVLKASYFASAKPGPGVLLLHQSNRTRKSWDEMAGRLAASGISTLTLDVPGHGESGGTRDDKTAARGIETAFQYLVSQPGVQRDVIGVGGAGWLGVLGSIEVARQHSAEVKSLVLLAGPTDLNGRKFLREATKLRSRFS